MTTAITVGLRNSASERRKMAFYAAKIRQMLHGIFRLTALAGKIGQYHHDS